MGVEVQETEETSAPAVTDELISELKENPGKMRELDPALRNAVLARIQEQDTADEAEESTDDADGEGSDKTDKPEDGTKTDDEGSEKEPKPEDEEKPARTPDKIRDEIRETSNKANQLEQKLAAAKARLKRAEEAEAKVLQETPDAPDDVFEDEKPIKDGLGSLKKLHAKVARLEALLETDPSESIASLESELEQQRELGVFSEFAQLQEEFPELQTKTPIAELNAQYAQALDTVTEKSGLKAQFPDLPPGELQAKAITWYNEQPEAERAKMGVTFPEELDKLGLAIKLWDTKGKLGGTLEGHYLTELRKSGTLSKLVQKSTENGAKQAARETVKAVQQQGKELKTIGPGDGNPDGYTKQAGPSRKEAEATVARLTPLAGRWTPAQREEHRAALKVLSGG